MAPWGPRGGQSLGRGPKGEKAHLSPETVCRFSSNLVGLIPKGFESEVIHMGPGAPRGPGGWGGGQVKNEAKLEYLLVQIQ